MKPPDKSIEKFFQTLKDPRTKLLEGSGQKKSTKRMLIPIFYVEYSRKNPNFSKTFLEKALKVY